MTKKAAKTRITVYEAAKAALDFFDSFYREKAFEDVLLEEIRRTEDGSQWEITVGYSRPNRNQSTFDKLSGSTPQFIREYKTLTVDAGSGDVDSMNIRTV